MKKLIFKIVGTLSVIVIITIWSCQKTSNSSVSPIASSKSGGGLGNSIGYWHNYILRETSEFINRNRSTHSPTTYLGLVSFIIDSLNAISTTEFPMDTLTKDTGRLFALQSSIGIQNELKSAFRVDSTVIKPMINSLYSEGRISSQLTQQLLTLNTEVYKGTITETALVSTVNGLTAYSSSDAYYINVGIQVADSSSVYWNTHPQTGSCDLCTVWADVAGGIWGSLLGPIGALVEGGIFSSLAIINNQ